MWINILRILQTTMNTPTSFGAFHLTSVFLVLLLTALLIWKCRDADGKRVRRILFVFWILMVVGEIYKQIVFAFTFNELGEVVKKIEWYAFPFQLCSTPLYVLPFVIFMKDGKARDCFLAFLTTFSLFGGLAVYVFPNDVFIQRVGVNIQTMLHHGLQITIGLFLVSRCRRRFTLRYYLGGTAVFFGLLLTAMGLNELGYRYVTSYAPAGMEFNMFYLSPYYKCTLPVLSGIQPKVPYPVFLAIYILGFMLVAFVIFGIEKGIIHCINKRAAAKSQP